jgi:hypothetical protein
MSRELNIEVGDRVRVGGGRRLWRVIAVHERGVVDLVTVGGPRRTAHGVEISRLKLVES